MKIIMESMSVYYEDPSEFGSSYIKLYAVGWRIKELKVNEDGTLYAIYNLTLEDNNDKGTI